MGQNLLSIKMLKNNPTLDNSYCIFISLTAEMEAKVELGRTALEIQCMADGMLLEHLCFVFVCVVDCFTQTQLSEVSIKKNGHFLHILGRRLGVTWMAFFCI